MIKKSDVRVRKRTEAPPAGATEEDDDKLGQAVTNMSLTSLKRLVGRQAVTRTGTSRDALRALTKGHALHRGLARSASRISALPSNQSLLGVRNESICYKVFVGRAKPGNSVRINPAIRHSETKYGFVILTGDMIFKDFFVGVKLLLRHEHPQSAAANGHQNQLTCHASKTRPARRLTCSPFDRRRLSPHQDLSGAYRKRYAPAMW